MLRSMIALLLVVGVMLPVQAQVNALPQSRHILVYGDAQARAIPDRFRIDIAVSEIHLDVGTARSTVESHMQALLKRLRESGVPEAEITATSLRISSDTRWDDEAEQQVFVGTRVSRSIQARFSRREVLERFLADTSTSQAIQISSVTTEVSTEAELRKALRQKAIESSREKAEVIAEAYGAKLGALYSVSDVAPQFQYGIREGNWPTRWQWSENNEGQLMLDRVQVMGSHVYRDEAPIEQVAESFHAGYQNFEDKIYAVFLLAD